MNKNRIGAIQKKILLCLLSGLTIGLSASPARAFRIMRLSGKEWQRLNREKMWRSIRALYQSKMVDYREDGSIVTLTLSKRGEKHALQYSLEKMKISIPPHWDGKWRIVLFDIPEKRKKARNAIRWHLRQLGFLELQKSVFVFPYPCDAEVMFLIEFFQLNLFVRIILAESIDNELHLKQKFKLKFPKPSRCGRA